MEVEPNNTKQLENSETVKEKSAFEFIKCCLVLNFLISMSNCLLKRWVN